MKLVKTTYGDGAMEAGKAQYWTVFITMVRIIFRELRNVQFEVDMEYGSETQALMVGQYLWGTLHAHRVMDDLLRTQF